MVEWSVCPMWFDIWLAVGREGGGGGNHLKREIIQDRGISDIVILLRITLLLSCHHLPIV